MEWGCVKVDYGRNGHVMVAGVTHSTEVMAARQKRQAQGGPSAVRRVSKNKANLKS